MANKTNHCDTSVCKSTRFKTNPDRVFDCYCEVSFKIRESNGITTRKPWIKRRFPDTYKVKEVLESVPKFAYPCENLPVDATTNFSFVLTNIDSKWTFGFCQLCPSRETCLVMLSHLPWHDTFFQIISHIGSIYNLEGRQQELLSFLKSLYQCKVPNHSGGQLLVQSQSSKHTFPTPNYMNLSSIPEDPILTEYNNSLNVDNMIRIFASALNERHILVVSKKLDRLSSCVQAINTLLYPMSWQHICIPVLPSDLLAYLQAPMPFLIGVPEPTYRSFKSTDLPEAVLVLADDNLVKPNGFDDVRSLPPGVVNSIKSDLKNSVAVGDTVSRAFLKALVMLIGGYREALEFNNGEKITFNHDRFIATRPASFQPFLKKMLELQMFRQFIEGRLEILNSGQGFNDDFEFEVNLYEERTANRVKLQYQDWLNAMKTKGGVFFRSINPSLRLVYRGLRDKSKQTYKDLKVKLSDTQSQSSLQAPSFLYSRMD